MKKEAILTFATIAVIALLFSPLVGACAADAKEIRVISHRWFQDLAPGTTEFTMSVEVTNPEEGDIVVVTAMTDKEWDMGNINAFPDEQQLWTVGSTEIKKPEQGCDVWTAMLPKKRTVFIQVKIGSCSETAEVCGDESTGAELIRLTTMVVNENTAKRIGNRYNTETTLRKLGAMRTSAEVCVKRPCSCSEPCQEQVAVWFTSPECGECIGTDTTKIPVSWQSTGTQDYTIVGLATTNQPWDMGKTYLMDILDGSKLGGTTIFSVGSCADTADGEGKGASIEYLELVAVKDEDMVKINNLNWPVNRAALDKYVQASDSIWVERPCGCGIEI